MNLINIHFKHFIFTYLLLSGLKTSAQNETHHFTLDTSLFITGKIGRFQPTFNYIYHSPGKKHEQRFKKYKYLIGQKPTLNNYEQYYLLACSLWNLEKVKEAEQIFLTIINSTDKYYTSTSYHSSDISGDAIRKVYSYGSYTSNYKNYAAIYLTKIYLEQKQFDKALEFLEYAVKKYKVTYNCGTGFYRQQDEYDFLYASCYEGLKRHKDIIDLLLPGCLDRNDDIIITAIKNTYSTKEIQEGIQRAETSIECSLDTSPTYSYQTSDYGTKKEKTDTITYFSGTATIMLFNRQVKMPIPDLENGEHLTMEMFIKLFRESDFYIKLKASI